MLNLQKRLTMVLANLRLELNATEPTEAKMAMQRAIVELEAARDAVHRAWLLLRSVGAIGAIDDEPFVRPPQGKLPPPVDLD